MTGGAAIYILECIENAKKYKIKANLARNEEERKALKEKADFYEKRAKEIRSVYKNGERADAEIR